VNFLIQAILIEIIKKYPESEELEKVYKSLTKNYQPQGTNFVNWLVQIGSKTLGYNDKDTSAAIYLRLRYYVDHAFNPPKPEVFTELLWIAGECAHHTLMNSPNSGSEISKASSALRSYLIYKIFKRSLKNGHKLN
jgi:hypothetical protein